MLSRFFESGNNWVECHCDRQDQWFVDEFKGGKHFRSPSRWRRFAFNLLYGLESGYPICCVVEYSVLELLNPCVANWARVCWNHGKPWGKWQFVGPQRFSRTFEEHVPCWFHQLSIRPEHWAPYVIEYSESA